MYAITVLIIINFIKIFHNYHYLLLWMVFSQLYYLECLNGNYFYTIITWTYISLWRGNIPASCIATSAAVFSPSLVVGGCCWSKEVVVFVVFIVIIINMASTLANIAKCALSLAPKQAKVIIPTAVSQRSCESSLL